jgi:hypothetical protein
LNCFELPRDLDIKFLKRETAQKQDKAPEKSVAFPVTK